MTGIVLCFLAGQLLSAWERPEPWVTPALVVVWGCVWGLSRKGWIVRASAAAAMVAIGLSLAATATDPPSGDCFLPRAEGASKEWIELSVDDAPLGFAGGFRLRARARVPGRHPERICGTLLLTLDGLQEPTVGERLRLHASLRAVRNFANPRAYDHAAALARRGIWATAHAIGSEMVRQAGSGGAHSIAGARQRIGRLIDRSLAPIDASLLRALVIGDEAAVPAWLWEDITAAGLAHLLSVSGLHVALVWGVVFAAVRWLLSRSEWLLLHAHVRAIAALGALAPALVYAELAGLSIPAARSVGMTALFVTILAIGREVRPRTVLCLTAGLISLVWPGSPLDVSFQLSFASVLSLMLLGEAWSRPRNHPLRTGWMRLWEGAALACLTPAAALIGTAPLVALHFNRWTPIGLITNPVLVPLAGVPATLVGLVGAAVSNVSEALAVECFGLASWPLRALRWGASTAVSVPYGSVRVFTPTLLEVALAYALLALPWSPPRPRWFVAGILSLIAAVDVGAWTHERWIRADLRVRFLDVGQGDAAVVELPHGPVLVIDGGGFARSRFDVGERVIAPYLWSRKIRRVDFLVASHGDWDHQGGLHYLARTFSPRELWVTGRPTERARLSRLEDEVLRAGGRVRTLAAGQRLLLSHGVTIDCLHPPEEGELSSNDSSLVLRLRLGNDSLLFTGDIETRGESMVVAGEPNGPVDLLKVPHHGSKTSSTEALLRWAQPRIALFSLGAGNAYGFPHSAVLERYRRIDARAVRTDRDGSLGIVTDGTAMEVRTWRGEAHPHVCSLLGALC